MRPASAHPLRAGQHASPPPAGGAFIGRRPTEAPLGGTRCGRCIGTTQARASSRSAGARAPSLPQGGSRESDPDVAQGSRSPRIATATGLELSVVGHLLRGEVVPMHRAYRAAPRGASGARPSQQRERVAVALLLRPGCERQLPRDPGGGSGPAEWWPGSPRQWRVSRCGGVRTQRRSATLPSTPRTWCAISMSSGASTTCMRTAAGGGRPRWARSFYR
jgi:hypothetical protein